MPRGYSYLLSQSDEARLRKINTKHPRIRRSNATKIALATIIKEIPEPSDGTNISITKYPPVLRHIIRRINWTHLRRKKDLKLVPVFIWRIFFRKTIGKLNVVPSKDKILLHRAIYIQRRHSTLEEIALGRQKRVTCQKRLTPSHPHPISHELSNIRSVTTIDQTGSDRLLYTCTDLHSRPHGSIHHNDISNKNVLYQSLGINHKILSIARSGPRRVSKHDDVTVAFDGAAFMKNLRRALFSKCKVELSSFEKSFTRHVLSRGKTRDLVRCNGTLDDTNTSVNIRLQFYFGRIQKRGNLVLNGTTFPGVNVKAFQSMPPVLKKQLVILFENSTTFTKSWIKDSFQNKSRNAQCAGYLNAAMGFPNSTPLFEFFDVVVTRNTTLQKHTDHKNDHRKGYNLCTVYSYVVTLNGADYKVSIIMTTRTTVGSACDKAGMVNNQH